MIVPLDGIGIRTKGRRGTETVILENISRMIQHHIENDIDPARMRFIDKPHQLTVHDRRIASRGRRIACEAGINSQEILEPVTVVGTILILTILNHGRQPDRTDAELL